MRLVYNWSTLLILLIFLFILSTFLAIEAQAIPTGALEISGLSVSPAISKVTAKQGETVETEIRFKNLSNEVITVQFEIQDFEKHGEQLVFLEKPKDLSISVASWSEIMPTGVISLVPQEWKTAKVTINVPPEAIIGEHAAAARLRLAQPVGEMVAGAGAAVGTGLTTAFYVWVTDQDGEMDINKDWQINNITSSWWNGGNFVFNLTNTGNVHLFSEGTFEIYSWWSDEIIESKSIAYTNFLPGATKDIITRWQKPARLGLFRADIALTMDQGEKYEHYQQWFVRVPAFVVITVVVVFFLTLLFIKLYLRHIKKRLYQEFKQNQSKKTG